MSTQTKPQRAALYARSAVQSPGAPISPLVQQMDRLRTLARARGWTIVAEHVEVASGSQRHRAHLDQILSEGAHRQFDVLLVDDLSRLSRNASHLVEILDQLKRAGIALALADSPENDGTSPAGHPGLIIKPFLRLFKSQGKTWLGEVSAP